MKMNGNEKTKLKSLKDEWLSGGVFGEVEWLSGLIWFRNLVDGRLRG